MTGPARFRVLAAHARALDDEDLNELLVELPRERFAALLAAAFPRWRTPVTPPVPLRRRQDTPAGLLPDGWQELARWTVHARVPNRRAANGAAARWRAIGTVSHTAHPASGGCWVAFTPHGRPVGVDGLWGWDRRTEATAALAEATPATGARAAALATYVRALDDTTLNELLVQLPCERFDRLCDAAFAEPEGVA
jgi:hypothetical protein